MGEGWGEGTIKGRGALSSSGVLPRPLIVRCARLFQVVMTMLNMDKPLFGFLHGGLFPVVYVVTSRKQHGNGKTVERSSHGQVQEIHRQAEHPPIPAALDRMSLCTSPRPSSAAAGVNLPASIIGCISIAKPCGPTPKTG